MILVHHDRNVRIRLNGCFNQMTQERLARVLPRARRRLHDYRGADLIRRRHDGLHLLQIVYVECRKPIAVFGGMVQQLTH